MDIIIAMIIKCSYVADAVYWVIRRNFIDVKKKKNKQISKTKNINLFWTHK